MLRARLKRGSPRGFGEQGNIGKISKGTREHKPIFGNKGTKFEKITVRKHSDIRNREHLLISRTWEHRAILEGNKGTRTPPGRPFMDGIPFMKMSRFQTEEDIRARTTFQSHFFTCYRAVQFVKEES